MNSTDRLIWIGILLLAVIVFYEKTNADTGKYAATRIEVGNTFQTRIIVLSATTTTQIAASADNRPDETCFNNSPGTIWLSSATASTTAIGMGFPILSSGTFRLGSLTGAVSALCNSGSCEVRCGDGLTQ